MDTGRSIHVTSQQSEDVVFATLASQCDKSKIGWVSTVVGVSGGLFVWIWAGHIVRQFARAIEVGAGVIGTIADLKYIKLIMIVMRTLYTRDAEYTYIDFGGFSLGFVLGKENINHATIW